jgi:hypothetical protein
MIGGAQSSPKLIKSPVPRGRMETCEVERRKRERGGCLREAAPVTSLRAEAEGGPIQARGGGRERVRQVRT